MIASQRCRQRAHRPTTHIPRRGWTLIELSVTITMLATLSVLAIQILSLLLRFDTSSASHAAHALSCERFAERFRNDVHDAVNFELIPAANSPETFDKLTLTLPEGTLITYHCETGGVRRVIAGADAMHPLERNLFRLGESDPRFDEQSGRLRVLLPGPYSTVIEAVPGRRGS